MNDKKEENNELPKEVRPEELDPSEGDEAAPEKSPEDIPSEEVPSADNSAETTAEDTDQDNSAGESASDEDFDRDIPEEDFYYDYDVYDDEDYDREPADEDDHGQDFYGLQEEEDSDLTASRAAAEAARSRSSRSRKKRARMVIVQKIGIGLLIAAAIGLVIVYAAGCVYFGSHFQFHTTLNGTDVSLMDESAVEETLLAAAEDYTLTLEGRNGVTDTIEGAAIDLEPVFDGTIGILISEQSVFSWPMTLFASTELISDSTASFDNAALAEIIADLEFYENENITAPVDATYTFGENGLEIVEASYGSTPDTAGLTAAVITALDGFVTTLELDDSCYVSPDITADSEELLATLDALNAILETEITLIFDEDAEGLLDSASILQMLAVSDGTPVAYMEEEDGTTSIAASDIVLTSVSVSGEEDDAAEDKEDDADAAGADTENTSAELTFSGVLGTSFTFREDLVADYVSSLADRYDTYGNDLEFETTNGETVTVPGGNYGWLMDRTSTAAALWELLNSGEDGELEIIWTQTAEQFGEDDIGDTYAEVDLDEQKVYLYVEGELVLSTDCVSGKAVDSSRYTPDGVFRIMYRKSPATLVGEDYESYVTYWMPFNGGIGFHDASWRSNFGGEIYLTNGSHGCINLPSSAAETLYSYVYTGMPVIVHGGMSPEEAIEYTGYTVTTSDDEDDVTTEEDAAAQEDEIIALAIANYVALGMTEEEATAQVNADLAEQLAAQQAAAAAAAQAAEQSE